MSEGHQSRPEPSGLKFVLNQHRLRKNVNEFPQTGRVLREKCCSVVLPRGFYGSCPSGCRINLYHRAIPALFYGFYGRNRRVKLSLLKLAMLRTSLGKPARSFRALVMVPSTTRGILISQSCTHVFAATW